MGCISSKVVSRSLSFQEELNRRRANGDHFLALLSSSANSQIISTSFSSESNKCSKPTLELVRNETSDTWKFKPSLQQEEKKQVQPLPPKVTESIEVDLARRSKSFHCFDDYEVASLPPESFHGGRTRSRSFHTVEEFDAICLSRAGQTWFRGKEDDSLQLRHSKSSSYLSKPCRDESGVAENTKIELKPEKSIPSTTTEETTQKGNISVNGLKRKKRANELETLTIPPSIEFPGVTQLPQWHAGGQVYSPGTYATPKFGSYNLPKPGLPNKCCSEGTVFDPELVAAFQECMEQLEVEEESILKQFVNLKEENTQKKQGEE